MIGCTWENLVRLWFDANISSTRDDLAKQLAVLQAPKAFQGHQVLPSDVLSC